VDEEKLFAEKLIKLFVQTGFGIVAFFATMFLATKFDINTVPLVDDAQQYFYQAERVADGVSLYHSQFEPKSGLGILLPGLSIAVGRLVGIPDLISPRLLSTLALMGSIFCAQAICFRFTRKFLPALATGFAVLACPPLVNGVLSGSEPRVYLVLFLFLALFACTTRRTRWAGAASMAAFLVWQPAFFALLAVGIACQLHPPAGRGWKAGFYNFLAGCCVVAVPYTLYFVAMGSFGAMLDQTVYFPGRFLADAEPGILVGLPSLILFWGQHCGGHGLLLVAALLAGVRYLLHSLRGKNWALIRRRDRRPHFESDGWGAYISVSIVTILFTLHQHQDPADLLFLLPFVSIGVGLLVYMLSFDIGRIGEMTGFASSVVLASAAIIASLSFCASSPARLAHSMGAVTAEDGTITRPYSLKEQKVLSLEVQALFDLGNTLHCIGNTHLLGMIRQPNWNRYGYVFPAVDAYIWKVSKEKFSPKHDGKWPDIVFLSRCEPYAMNRWMKLYDEVDSPNFNAQGIRRFDRNSSPEEIKKPKKKAAKD